MVISHNQCYFMFMYIMQFSRKSTCLASGKTENYPSVKILFSYMSVTVLISLKVEDIFNKKNINTVRAFT